MKPLTMHGTTTATAPVAATIESDAEIIARSLDEPDRFAEVFDRHYPRIHAYVTRRLGPVLGDDVASETFLTAFKLRSRYDAVRPDAAPWLYGIASNLVLDRESYELRGQTSTAANRRVVSTRVAAGVVDEPGLRP